MNKSKPLSESDRKWPRLDTPDWGHWCRYQEPVQLPADVICCPQCGAFNWDRIRESREENQRAIVRGEREPGWSRWAETGGDDE